jgi:organic hydroperoxide reductase OsmC/OhrA
MSAGDSTEMSVTRRDRGVRVARMPVDGDVLFGVQGELAERYSEYAKEPEGREPHAAATTARSTSRDGQLTASCPISRTLRGNVETPTDYELHQP